MTSEILNSNPWWQESRDILPTNFISRKSLETKKHCLNEKEISIFQGIFQSGKTTLLLFLINELLTKLYIQPKRVFYLNCKNTSINLENISLVIEQNSPYKTFLFLDDLDYLEDSSSLQKIINKHDSLIKICATSTQNKSFNFQHEKTIYYETSPLSFREILEKKYPEFSEIKFSLEGLEIINKKYNFDNIFEDYLLFGGLPEIFKKKEKLEKKAGVEGLLTKFVKTEEEENIYKYLAIKNSNLLNMSNLGSEIGISRYKAEKLLLDLEKYKMINLLPSLEININKSLVKSYKIFFHDLGIRNALLRSFNGLQERIDNEALYQNFVALETYYALKNSEMYFFRTTNQTEINFVISSENDLIPIQIQITGSQKNIPRIFTSFYRKTKNRISKMIVVTKNYLNQDKLGKADIYFIPAPLFSLFDWNR